MDERAQQLFDEGAAILASAWDEDAGMVRHAEHPSFHDPRATLSYAEALRGPWRTHPGNPVRIDRASSLISVRFHAFM